MNLLAMAVSKIGVQFLVTEWTDLHVDTALTVSRVDPLNMINAMCLNGPSADCKL